MWGAPLWAHVTTLGVLLLALVPVVGTSYSFSPDEAVAITQARSLAQGQGWMVEHPFSEIDPEDHFYPVAGSSRGADGIAPFAKHPIYPLVLAGLHGVGGISAMVVLSVLGTVAAAAFAALLAREATGGLERPVVWAVGVASPLLFDAYLVIAHSLGAALVTAAVLAVVRSTRRLERQLPARTNLLLAAATCLLVVAVLLRSEALIFALALGVATFVTGVTIRRPILPIWAMVMAGSGMAAAVLEKQLQSVFIGGDRGMVALPTAEGGGFFAARLAGFLNTWLLPTSDTTPGAALMLVVVVALAAAAVLVLRFRPKRPEMLLVLSAGATVLVVLAFLAQPTRVIPGLLVAFPLAVFGIGLVDRTYFEPPGRLVLTVTAGLFIAGVLATQYPVGGSSEWGGRYFALAIPILTVLAVDALARRAPAVPVPVRQWSGAGLVACSVLLAIGAVSSMANEHTFNQSLLVRMEGAASDVVPGDGGAPVVVTPWPNIARHAWPTHSNERWLYNADEELAPGLAMDLQRAGVAQLLFVGQDHKELAPYLDTFAIDEERSFKTGKWEVSVLVARPSGS